MLGYMYIHIRKWCWQLAGCFGGWKLLQQLHKVKNGSCSNVSKFNTDLKHKILRYMVLKNQLKQIISSRAITKKYHNWPNKGSQLRRKAAYLWTLSVCALTPPPTMTLWTPGLTNGEMLGGWWHQFSIPSSSSSRVACHWKNFMFLSSKYRLSSIPIYITKSPPKIYGTRRYGALQVPKRN